jgi:pyruvate formate lyase activating enzyme
MVIGGIQKNSFIDFPGRISCVLFLSGCNFHCPYCHNPDLARGLAGGAAAEDIDQVHAFLASRRSLLEGVVISGGEPTLHADIHALCESVRALGYPVKLDTNGSRPDVLRELLANGLVDYIAMDIKTAPQCYAPVFQSAGSPAAICRSIEIIMDAAPAYEFRTTCVRPIIDEAVIAVIARTIAGADRYVLQHFENQRLLAPSFFAHTDPAIGPRRLLGMKAVAQRWVKRCSIR